jgi:hypothetical protein
MALNTTQLNTIKGRMEDGEWLVAIAPTYPAETLDQIRDQLHAEFTKTTIDDIMAGCRLAKGLLRDKNFMVGKSFTAAQKTNAITLLQARITTLQA